MPEPRRATNPLRRLALGILVPFLLAGQARAQAAPPAPERFRLANGLEVDLIPDRATQVVAVEVWYEAGSRHDPAGRAGLAQLFERLMFAGSPHVPIGGHARIVEDVGGKTVASVDEELSRFGEVLPSSRLGLGLWLEAERMRGIAIDDSVIASVIGVRLSELAGQTGAESYRDALLRGMAAVYDSAACTSVYGRPLSAVITGLSALTGPEVRDFFLARYTPGNARLVVAGDFEPRATRALVESYFGGIPSGPRPAVPACADAAVAVPRRISLSVPGAPEAAAGLFFPIPSHDHPDIPGLELLEIILSRGSFSHLSRELASDPGRMSAWQAGVLGLRRAPGVFGFFGVAGDGVPADSVARFFAAQAAWIESGAFEESDLARARQIQLATAASTRERPGDIARVREHGAVFHPASPPGGSPEETPTTITLEELRRIARTYFGADRAVTLLVSPGAGQ
jgi:zinc protease